jgi:hypothetical protein
VVWISKTVDDRAGIAAARPAWERPALESLWLSVVKAISGIGHLVLVVATTKPEIVMETEANSPWQSTDLNDRYEREDAAHSTKADNTRPARCRLTQPHHQSTYRKQNVPDPEQVKILIAVVLFRGV